MEAELDPKTIKIIQNNPNIIDGIEKKFKQPSHFHQKHGHTEQENVDCKEHYKKMKI